MLPLLDQDGLPAYISSGHSPVTHYFHLCSVAVRSSLLNHDPK